MSLMGPFRRSIIRLGYPLISAYYRTRAGRCSPTILRFLGIADPAYRTDFYTLHSIIATVARTGGLIAECGVYRGATLLGMAHTLSTMRAPDYHLVGFDSFEGFPEPVQQDTLSDGMYHTRALKGFFRDTSYEELSRKVHALGFGDQITLVKGYFDQTLSAWRDKSFALVHLDCDLYESYLHCLNFFYPRVKPGGYLVFDEYDFIADVYPGAQKAIDLFLADKPEKIQRLENAVKPRYFIVKQ
jgi:O-methyltransferase